MSIITRTKNAQTVSVDFKDNFICISTRGYELNLSFNEFEDLTTLITETINEIITEEKKNIELKVGLTFDEATKVLNNFTKGLNRPKFPENRLKTFWGFMKERN